MTIVAVKELWEGRKAGLDYRNVRTYERVWRVVTGSPLDGPLQVISATGIPLPWAVYDIGTESDLGATARDITPTQDQDDPTIWLVTVRYSSERIHSPHSDTPQSGDDSNPFSRPPDIDWAHLKFQRTIEQDLSTPPKNIVNTAGQRFLPGVEIDDSRLQLIYTRNEPAYNPTLAFQYMDAVNGDFFWGFGPGTAKMANIGATSVWEKNFFYWRVRYEIHFRQVLTGTNVGGLRTVADWLNASGWLRLIRNEGLNQIKNGAYADILGFWGGPVHEPVPLDINGVALPPGATALYLAFQVYPIVPFGPLNLAPQ